MQFAKKHGKSRYACFMARLRRISMTLTLADRERCSYLPFSIILLQPVHPHVTSGRLNPVWLAHDIVMCVAVPKGTWAIRRFPTAAGWPHDARLPSSTISAIPRSCAISSAPATCADQVLRALVTAAAACERYSHQRAGSRTGPLEDLLTLICPGEPGLPGANWAVK